VTCRPATLAQFPLPWPRLPECVRTSPEAIHCLVDSDAAAAFVLRSCTLNRRLPWRRGAQAARRRHCSHLLC
jgi:hypothetical protein